MGSARPRRGRGPNGERWEHHVVHLDKVAIALLVNDQDEVLMLHRYRFAIDKWGYELLGGIVEEGEDPGATAKREAVEESGWRPLGKPTHLASFEPMRGMMTAQTDVFKRPWLNWPQRITSLPQQLYSNAHAIFSGQNSRLDLTH